MIIGEYPALEAFALSSKATQADLENLREWFEHFGNNYWNGECYEIDERHGLYPVYIELDGELKLSRLEVKTL